MASAIDLSETDRAPDWTKHAANLSEQIEEVSALKSFYENTNNLEVIHEADSDSKFQLEFTIPIETRSRNKKIDIELWLPIENINSGNDKIDAKKPKFERSVSGRRAHTKLAVEYLVPLRLAVTLPDTYPSESAPSYTLSSIWLNKLQLNQVCAKLDDLWAENFNMPVLFTWLEWLKTELVEYLDLVEDDSRLICTPLSEDVEDSSRAVCAFRDSEQFIYEFLRHNYVEEMNEFGRSMQTCLICFDEKPGVEFHRLGECRHHFCAACLGSMCQMHVKEGTIQLLK
jgi:hypothetical protein